MVSVYTNRPEFLNDIAEEIRLFLDIVEVRPAPNDTPGAPAPGDVFLSVTLSTGEDWRALARCTLWEDGPRSGEYEYRHPAVNGSALVRKRYEKRCVKIAAFRALRGLVRAYIPWGSLTGIRPTRLLRELIEEAGEEEALRIMLEEFDVRPEKLALTREIVQVQQPRMETLSPRDVDVYIGIPYCKTRCLYCSFAAEVRTAKTDMAAYLLALKRDISLGARIVKESGYTLGSLYMGGGTPTVLSAGELEDVLCFALSAYGGYGRELTVEAGRPDTITKDKLKVMKKLGVSRISINPQSMNQKTLDLIGRSHSAGDIRAAFDMAREAGFDNINMDVIAGLPGEDLADVEATLAALAALGPENLTVHTLAIKRSSRLKAKLEEYPLVDAQTAEAMVLRGSETARSLGMRPYYMYRQKYMRGNLENVGYALPGTECLYNIDMMEETTSIMAHGAGAMSKRIFGGEHRVERIPNPKDVAAYIAKVDTVAEQKRALYTV